MALVAPGHPPKRVQPLLGPPHLLDPNRLTLPEAAPVGLPLQLLGPVGLVELVQPAPHRPKTTLDTPRHAARRHRLLADDAPAHHHTRCWAHGP